VRKLGELEEIESPTPAFAFYRFLVATAAARTPAEREQALAPLFALMQLLGVGDTAGDEIESSASIHALLLNMHGRFGALLEQIDRMLKDGRVTPGEMPQLLHDVRALLSSARRTVCRLEKASRSKEQVR
jgi:hypothetical protein